MSKSLPFDLSLRALWVVDFGLTLGRLHADFGRALGRLQDAARVWADSGPTLGRLQDDFGPTSGQILNFTSPHFSVRSIVRTLGLKHPVPVV